MGSPNAETPLLPIDPGLPPLPSRFYWMKDQKEAIPDNKHRKLEELSEGKEPQEKYINKLCPNLWRLPELSEIYEVWSMCLQDLKYGQGLQPF